MNKIAVSMARILASIDNMSGIWESLFAAVCVTVKVSVMVVAVHVETTPVIHCEVEPLEPVEVVEEGPLPGGDVRLVEIVAVATKQLQALVRPAPPVVPTQDGTWSEV
jgi:hypothetical protein